MAGGGGRGVVVGQGSKGGRGDEWVVKGRPLYTFRLQALVAGGPLRRDLLVGFILLLVLLCVCVCVLFHLLCRHLNITSVLRLYFLFIKSFQVPVSPILKRCFRTSFQTRLLPSLQVPSHVLQLWSSWGPPFVEFLRSSSCGVPEHLQDLVCVDIILAPEEFKGRHHVYPLFSLPFPEAVWGLASSPCNSFSYSWHHSRLRSFKPSLAVLLFHKVRKLKLLIHIIAWVEYASYMYSLKLRRFPKHNLLLSQSS